MSGAGAGAAAASSAAFSDVGALFQNAKKYEELNIIGTGQFTAPSARYFLLEFITVTSMQTPRAAAAAGHQPPLFWPVVLFYAQNFKNLIKNMVPRVPFVKENLML